jgi:hypothetical protein
LVVGAPLENGSSNTVNGNKTLLNTNDAGAAYIYVRNGSTWSEQAYLKASNVATNAYFGWATAVSSDGGIIAVSAVGEAINGASDAGAVYVFKRANASGTSSWSQAAYLTASNAGANDNFGTALALSDAGSIVAVGAPYESSADGSQANNSATNAGAVYVFANPTGDAWSQSKYLKSPNIDPGDNFGAAVSLSGAGNVLAVGAPYEQSSAIGVDGSSSGSANLAGAAYVFSGSNWSKSVYIKASNTGANDNFGTALALNRDGDWLVVGAIGESSKATGIDGNQADDSTTSDGVGAAYIYTLSNNVWSQKTYLKPATWSKGSEFGSTFGVSADTRTLAIGATFEKGATSGLGGDQASTAAADAGAVWLY